MASPQAAAPQQRQNTAIARRPEQAVGTFRDPQRVTEALRQALSIGHLVSPATVCGSLPEGCEVALSTVLIDVARETYNTGGDLYGLSKTALDRISAGVGVSWLEITRLDNGRHPLVREYEVAGVYRAFDGQEQWIRDRKDLDLREGSPDVDAIRSRAKDGKSADKQLRDMRMFIDEHCITKARLRAIRTLGLRTGYTKDELGRPFVTARILFTGRTDDPALRRLFAEKTAEAFLGGRAGLYGPSQRQPQRTIEARPMEALPVASDLVDEEPRRELPPSSAGGAPPLAAAPPPAAEQRSTQADTGPQPRPNGMDTREFRIPGGKAKGTTLDQADDRELEYWGGRLAGDLDSGKTDSRYRERDERLLLAIQGEQAYRQGDTPDMFDHEGSGSDVRDDDVPY